MLRKALRLCSLLLLHHFSSFAQYCTPTPTSGGVYMHFLHFATATDITGGTDQTSTGSPAYQDRSATPNGVLQRSCYLSMFFGVYNPANSATSFNLRVFIDWNGDGDFADSSETAYDLDEANLGALTSYGTGFTIPVPAFAASSIRLRFAIRHGGQKATPCGTYVGNIQDYTLTVPTNTAPTLNTSVNPVMNDLVETQTDNNGISIQQFIYSQSPGSPLMTSGEACEYNGIAITGTSGTNGQWQYKTNNGDWTNVGSVSNTNALLLSGGTKYLYFDSRIRFVPTGAGTASITYKAWDRSQGLNGQYANATTGGGSTAFSTASKTSSVTVLGAASATNDVKLYMPQYSNLTSGLNLMIGAVNRATGSVRYPEEIQVGNDDGFGNDVAIDAVNQKVLWSAGANGTDIFRCNLDGSGITKITGSGYTYITGLAVSDIRLFFGDQGNGLFTSNLDGSNVTPISGGAGQASDINDVLDMEYANNKIWYINRSSSSLPYRIVSANPTGTGTTTLYTAANSTTNVLGLAVTGTNLYWTETASDATSTIKRMNIATGTITTLCTENIQQYYDLFVDEANSIIYYISSDASTVSQPFNNTYIKTIPLAGGTPTRRFLLESTPYSLAFYIPTIVLPVKVVSIDAYKGTQQISINWKVTGEQEVVNYTIQKSTDGIHFQEIGKLTAAGKSNYTWPDANPAIGTNYYRISIAGKDGKATLTNVVKVDWGKESKPAVSIYPNIVSASRQVQVTWQNVVPGNYTIKAVNTVGQTLNLATVKVSGNRVQTIELPASLTAGAYWLQIRNGANVWNEKLIVP